MMKLGAAEIHLQFPSTGHMSPARGSEVSLSLLVMESFQWSQVLGRWGAKRRQEARVDPEVLLSFPDLSKKSQTKLIFSKLAQGIPRPSQWTGYLESLDGRVPLFIPLRTTFFFFPNHCKKQRAEQLFFFFCFVFSIDWNNACRGKTIKDIIEKLDLFWLDSLPMLIFLQTVELKNSFLRGTKS